MFKSQKARCSSQDGAKGATSKARRPIAITCALALAMSLGSCGILAGCSSNDSSSSSSAATFANGAITVTATGFSAVSPQNIEWGFSVVNNQDGQLARNVLFAVEACNAADQVIGGTSATISALYPGVETYAGGSMEPYEIDVAMLQAQAEEAAQAANAAAEAEGEEVPENVVATGNASAPIDVTTVSYIKVTPMVDGIEWTSTSVKPDQIEGVIKTDDIQVYTLGSSLSFETTYTVPEDSVFANNEIRAVCMVFDANGKPITGTQAVRIPGENGEVSLYLAESPGFEDYKIFFTPVE